MARKSTAERTSISKKTRFEVFKRDKFTCQYCGRKAPEIILNVDHINPVANGGDNEILNLITSCFDCNSGKKARLLDDSSIIEKQHQQLKELEERREQLDLLMQWKNSLRNINEEAVEKISDYIDTYIQPHSINEVGKGKIRILAKKNSVETIITAIDKSAERYLQYDHKGVTKDSAENFLNKISGIIYFDSLPPIRKKLGYINSIGKQRMSYWNDKQAYTILNNYTQALDDQDYNEEMICDDLDKDVIPMTKDCKSWTAWTTTLNKWIGQINTW